MRSENAFLNQRVSVLEKKFDQIVDILSQVVNNKSIQDKKAKELLSVLKEDKNLRQAEASLQSQLSLRTQPTV